MRKFFAFLAAIFFISVSPAFQARASAAVPQLIKYQGILKKSGAFVSGTKTMEFKIFDAEKGGSEKWTSGQVNVDVQQGVFVYALDPSGLDWGSSVYYIEVTIMDSIDSAVDGHAILTKHVMSPREQITSGVYALRAGDIDDGVITSSKIADGAVTDVKVSSISWSKLYGVPSDIGAAAADNLGNHTATTTLNMSGFDITNVSTVTASVIISSSVISDNVDGYNLSSQFGSISNRFDSVESQFGSVAVSTGEMASEISQLSASTATFVHKAGDSMSGVLYISTIAALTRLNFADGTAITTAVGIGGAGDNLGNHTATTTLNMNGNNIVNVAGYNVSQQFSGITASTASLTSAVIQLGISTT